jgi:hypothetical protein
MFPLMKLTKKMSLNVVLRWKPIAAAAALLAAPLAVEAGLVIDLVGDPNSPNYHSAQAYGEIKDSSGNNLADEGTLRSANGPAGPLSTSASLSAGGSSSAINTSSVLNGFASASASATMTVSNANGSFGYTAIASQGARSQVLFNSLETPGIVNFNFSVTGSSTEPFGESFGRLDFLVRPVAPATSFFDVFGGDALHVMSEGNFNASYTYVGSTANPLDVLFWSAAGTIVGMPGFGNAPNGANFTSTASFGNTFELTSIELFTAAGAPISEWALTDVESGQVVFNQNGRVGQGVPESSSSLALLMLALTGMGLVRQRQRGRG